MLRRILIRIAVISMGLALLTTAQCAAPVAPERVVETVVVEKEVVKEAEKIATKEVEKTVEAPAEQEVVRFVIWDTRNEFESQILDELRADFEAESGHEVDLIFLSGW